MRVALVVTTYERPDALARVLASVRAQTRAPDELVIADDGSGPATAERIAAHARDAAFTPHASAREAATRVVHAWQPHDGFRAGRARNFAVSRSTADYLLFVDGDMVLHPAFVADHVAAARRGAWVQGCRLPLSPEATRAVLAGVEPDRLRDALDRRHALQARRLPALARAVAPAAAAVLAIKACNQGVWRADFERVNGYDESLAGWGSEDKELCARLGHAGVRRRGLLWAALAWHLHHPPADRAHAVRNRALLAATRAQRRVVSPAGLDRHGANR